ncbi:MAG: IS5 family transposase [Deltaproteobacteria bacterium]|nr:IS5 family transposase [Deltaproteobacteria bacterium]
MAQRFRPSGLDSYYGECLYQMIVPKTHFLSQLKDLVNWEELTKDLADCYKGGAEYGPLPYHPAVPFKVLLLAYLYDLSERQVEEMVNENMPAKYFVGLAAHERAPDHSSLSVFKERILAREGVEAFEERFKSVVRLAKEKGIAFGRLQVVDSTHSVADVDVRKDKERQEQGKDPRDGGAAWGCKGSKRMKTAEGKTISVPQYSYGHKTHLSLNAQSKIITSVVATAGNAHDGKQFEKLVQKDEEVGVEAGVYAGDKAYDDGDNHELLREKGKKSALCLNRSRTEKKDPHKGLWEQMKASEEYEAGLKERYKVEQKNAEAKRWHGLGRCRYLGSAKYAVQALMTAMAMNLKRMVLLLCGVKFRGAARSGARA